MVIKKIKPVKLTSDNFCTYGKVIYTDGDHDNLINQGNSKTWSNLLNFEGKINMGILKTKSINPIQYLERHILTEYQIFIPLNNKESLLVVAEDNKEVFDESNPKFFLMKGNQGIVIKSKIWHHTLFPLKGEQEYLLINCGGKFPPDVETNKFHHPIRFEII